ncbi:MAG TPA: hypothetical protein GXX23_05070 [Firmicutes bacterium]|nr:hypothetical protein [Candidatus Fermentithermobacillaceae bacterium]
MSCKKPFWLGRVTVALLILVLVFSFAGCSGKYPTRQVSLVWETTIPSGSAVINAWDSGEADVRPSRVGDIVPPIVHFDRLGQQVAEFDKADIPCRYSTSLSHPTKFGWIVRDVQASPVSPYSLGYGLESFIKLVTRDGRVVWETRGPADAYVMMRTIQW